MSEVSHLSPLLLAAFFLVALLYASVGHGGASGYLALFALAGVAAAQLVPLVLCLNIMVASVACWHYTRAGYLRLPLLLPFVITSIPFAFLGGLIELPMAVFSVILGAALLLAAIRLFLFRGGSAETKPKLPRRFRSGALLMGAVLGILAGMIGIGGGVFLSPLLLLLRWTDVKETAAISAAFIVVNSISGLLGQLTKTELVVAPAALLVAIVFVGGFVGSRLGSLRLPPLTVRTVLASVLVLAGLKLVFKAVL